MPDGGITEAFAAITAGTATTAEVLTAVSTVGIGMSVVGAVTGNKTLSTLGAVMGVAGVVGGLASTAGSAAGGFGSAADVAAQNAAFGADAAGNFTSAGFGSAADVAAENAAFGADAAGNFAGGAQTFSYTNPADSIQTNSLPGSMNPDAFGQTGVLPEGVQTPGALSPSGSSTVPGAIAPTPTAPPGTAVAPAAAGPSATNIPQSQVAAQNASFGASADGTLSASAKPWWENMWAGMSPKEKAAAITVGGQALGGLGQMYTNQQKLAMEQQAQDYAHQAYLTSVKNANSQPVISMPSVAAVQKPFATPPATPVSPAAATAGAASMAPGLIQGAVGIPTTTTQGA